MRLTERGRLAALGAAGVVIGHTIAYLAAEPEGGHRAAVLRETGHAYWKAALLAAALAALVGAAAHSLRLFWAGRGGEAAPEAIPGAAVRLAAFQVVVFLAMEAAERVAAGAPVSSVLDRHVLLLGLFAQVLVAAALAQVLRLLGRAAAAIGRAVAAVRVWPSAPSSFRRREGAALALDALAALPCGSRAPPA